MPATDSSSIENYQVRCYAPGCDELATRKIAARWSDGVTHELKTYYMSCTSCQERLYELACAKQASCPLAPDETLERPLILAWSRGVRDRRLRPVTTELALDGEAQG